MDVPPAVWDAVVGEARQRHFLFEHRYLDYHADRFPDASLVIVRGGTPVAAIAASRHNDEVVSHAGLTFGGLLAHPSLGLQRTMEAAELALQTWRKDGARRLAVKPVPHIYHLVPAEEELFAWHALGARLTGRGIAQAVRAGAPRVDWSSERRRAARRATGSELTLGRSNSIEEFILLVRELLQRRHGAEPVHTPEEMRLLADRFPDAIKLYGASHAGELVAGVLIYETPAVAHCQYIGASARGHELRAQDALFAHLLSDIYPAKAWFDFGTSNEADGSANPGLVRHKEGFGARSITYDRYELEL